MSLDSTQDSAPKRVLIIAIDFGTVIYECFRYTQDVFKPSMREHITDAQKQVRHPRESRGRKLHVLIVKLQSLDGQALTAVMSNTPKCQPRSAFCQMAPINGD